MSKKQKEPPPDVGKLLDSLIEDSENKELQKATRQVTQRLVTATEDEKKGLILAQADDKSFDFKRLYQLAEVGCTLNEAANNLGIPPEEIVAKVQEQFKMSWKEYADTSTKALSSEIKAKLVTMMRAGNNRVLELYSKKFLGWGTGGGESGPNLDVSKIPDDELDERIAELRHSIERSQTGVQFPETVIEVKDE